MGNPYDIVRDFEMEIAAYAGSKYAVAVSSCTNALFLCCKYMRAKWVHIPKYTYPGVACSVLHSGAKLYFTDELWHGIYRLRPYHIYDAALRFQKNMYILKQIVMFSLQWRLQMTELFIQEVAGTAIFMQ